MSNTYFLQSSRFCDKCDNTLILKSISNNAGKFECRFCYESFSYPLPSCPIYRSQKFDCENIDPGLIKHFKDDMTLPLKSVPCPKCNYPQASVFTFNDKMKRKLSNLYLCQRKSPKCDFSWE